MAVDTIPKSPPTPPVHQRTEAANRYRDQRTEASTDRQAADKQAKEVVQNRVEQNADQEKASNEHHAEHRLDVRA
jgi:hypothetical protein